MLTLKKQNLFSLISWAFFTSRPINWLASLVIIFGFLSIPNGLNLSEAGLIFWLQIFSFTFPFNFVFYGINDWFDKESDKQNDRKLKSPWFGAIALDNPGPLIFISIICLIFSFTISILTFNIYNFLLVLACVFFGIFYSAPPLRLKSRLLLDTLTNGFGYIIIPFHIGYTFDGIFRFSFGILAMSLMALALHLGGAYMDGESDKKAGHLTTATILGDKPTFALILALFAASSLLYNQIWFYVFSGLIAFTTLPVLLIKNSKIRYIISSLVVLYIVVFLLWRFWVNLG